MDWCLSRQEAWEKRSVYHLRYPIQDGLIVNWESTEVLCRHLYANELHCASNDRSVVMTEPVDNPVEKRLKTIRLLFDHFHVPAVYMQNTAILALHASGRTTGLVVDLGHDSTTCVAVSDGKILPYTIHKTGVAGTALKEYFVWTMMERGVPWMAGVQRERAREIMEEVCYVALDPDQEKARFDREGETAWKKVADVCGEDEIIKEEQFLVGEVLFFPDRARRITHDSDHTPGLDRLVYVAVLVVSQARRRLTVPQSGLTA